MGLENFTTPAMLGESSSRRSSVFSMDFLPVPRITTCALGTWRSSLGMASIMMSQPFCSSRRPMYPKMGAEGSRGRPTSAWSACFAAALPMATVFLS